MMRSNLFKSNHESLAGRAFDVLQVVVFCIVDPAWKAEDEEVL